MLKYANLNEIALKDNYTILSELFAYEELPNTNPMVISDDHGIITFANKTFWTSFNLQYGNSLSQLSFEPDLGSSLNVFSKSNLSNIKYDHLYTSESGFKYFTVEIERIFFIDQQYFILNFIKNNPGIKLESKISSLSYALEFSKVALIIGDSAGKINYVTPSFEKILNRDIESIFDNTIPSVLYSHLPDKVFGKLISAVNSQSEWAYQATILLDSGEMKKVDLKLHIIRSEIENGFAYILTSEDVPAENEAVQIETTIAKSNLKVVSDEFNEDKLKSLLAKESYLNQLRNSLLNNLSHEIRTPYTAIAGYSEIVEEFLEEGNYNAVKEIVVSVKEVLRRVLNVFSNVVELSQIESGEITLDIVTLNCNQVLRSVFNKMKNSINDKDIEFILDEKCDQLLINIDWIKLEKILVVLVENSIKFTERGKIILASYSSDNNTYISVRDTGIGIESDYLESLIEPFAQEENGYTRSRQGAGLGLSVANKLTRLMNGTLQIISEKNKGTEIILRFPSAN